MGSHNTALGYTALVSNKTGGANVAVGAGALAGNYSGSYNIAIGYWTMRSQRSGNQNIAIGDRALFYDTCGSYNIAIGRYALIRNMDRSYLIAIGDSALARNGIGATTIVQATGNAAVGSKALKNNTTGRGNTALGNDALSTNIVGNLNTGVGYRAYFTDDDLRNTTCIGYMAGGVSNTNNRIEIGNTSVNWIGGEVGWSTYSDIRIKDAIAENVPGLVFITRLRPVTYHLNIHKQNKLCLRNKELTEGDWDGKYDIEEIKMTGFIAQEVEQAAKAVDYDFSGLRKAQDDVGMYSLQYSAFVVPLVKAVQELSMSNEQLKVENGALKKR